MNSCNDPRCMHSHMCTDTHTHTQLRAYITNSGLSYYTDLVWTGVKKQKYNRNFILKVFYHNITANQRGNLHMLL